MFEVQQGRGGDAGAEAGRSPSLRQAQGPRGTGGDGWMARISAGGLVALAIAVPSQMAAAHQTLISDGVGGTHHIEPNDTPRAGEPSQAWFALTQTGGTAIGLSDCDCELRLLGAGGEAIATPALTAIAVEGLTDVPAAELTFPQVGAYVLTLTGRPRGTADFPDFRLDFPITVAAGKAWVEPAGADMDPLDQDAKETTDPGTDGTQAASPEDLVENGFPLLSMGLFVVCSTVLALVWRGRQR